MDEAKKCTPCKGIGILTSDGPECGECSGSGFAPGPRRDLFVMRREAAHAKWEADREIARLSEEVDVLRGLVAANAEHAERLTQENAEIRAKWREAEAKPKEYEWWKHQAYVDGRNSGWQAGVEALSAETRLKFLELEKTVEDYDREIGEQYRRRLKERRRRQEWVRLAEANRAQATHLNRLYQKWRARAEGAEKREADRWANRDNEAATLRVEAKANWNDALELAKLHVRTYFDACPGAIEQVRDDLLTVLEGLKQ